MRLAPIAEGSRTWTEAQSKKNFEVVSKLVVPGKPLESPLLLKPLATAEGGAPTHAGGKHWKTKEDPEFKILSEWVQRTKR